jgi:hypothetical protein
VNLRAHGSSLSLRRRRLTLAALIGFAALAAALVGLLAFFATRAEAVPDSYGWQVGCRYSHVNQDDAIVFPSQPGFSHQHMYFGSNGVDAFTNYQSLRGSPTTCAIGEDTSGYWTPTLLVNGVPQKPTAGQFYYRARTNPEDVQPFPPGLRIVAGDAKATGPQSDQVVDWGCNTDSTLTGHTAPINCSGSSYQMVHVYFPDCWNGVDLDSPDHKSHMAYSGPGGPDGYYKCPAGYPVPLPHMRFKITWPTVKSAAGISLSSGPYYTLHGDFFNGWEQGKLAQMTRDCINAVEDCGTFLNSGSAPATPPIPLPVMPKMPPPSPPATGGSSPPATTPAPPGAGAGHGPHKAKKKAAKKAKCRPVAKKGAAARAKAARAKAARAKAARAKVKHATTKKAVKPKAVRRCTAKKQVAKRSAKKVARR